MYEQPDDSNSSDEFEPLPVIDTTTTNVRYKKVGGWLLLLCISLTILNPLLMTVSIVSTYVQLAPLFELLPGVRVVLFLDALMAAGVVWFSIHAGLGLWGIRPGAVQVGKRFLLVVLAYLLISPCSAFLFAGFPPEANQAMLEETIKTVTRGLIYVAIWYSYLGMSKRVKETFDDA